MNIKEQLDKWIEREGDKIPQFDTAYMDLQQAYKAGANDIAELLLIAVGALKYSSEKLSDGQYHDADDEIYKALNKIQEKIKGEL